MNIKFNNEKQIFKICFTGMMLSLIMIFQYLEQYIPPGITFTKINLSLVFILITQYVLNWRWAATLLLLRFLIAPGLGQNGYTVIGITAQMIALVSDLIFMFLFYLVQIVILKRIKEKNIKLIITMIIVVPLASATAAMCNALVFTPLFWWVWGFIPDAKLSTAISYFNKHAHEVWMKTAFFGITNYWWGELVSFGLGFIIKYSSISVIYLGLLKVIEKIKK